LTGGILIIRLALLLIFVAIADFLLAMVLDQLTITSFSVQLSSLGSLMLLFAFSLLLLTGLWTTFRLMLTSCCNYFSISQRMERRLLFYTNQRNRLNRLFHFKKYRLLYVNLQKRKKAAKKA
jgi:hypothetical protein